MNTLNYIIIFSLVGGVVSLLGGALILKSKKNAQKLALYATPFAGGALLAAVFLDLLPEGIEADDPNYVLAATLLGIIIFFLAEGFLHWFHHHHEHGEEEDPRKWLVVVGDTLHNALDGVAIAASFMISIPTGVVTTMAVAAHEIPQEIGDFGILLSKGMSRRKVLAVNFMSALATLGAALITYWLGSEDALPLGVLLGLSAGFLLYIAMSDIIPAIHSRQSSRRLFDLKALLLVLGVLIVGAVTTLAHQYIEPAHPTDETPKAETTLVKTDWACTYYFDDSGTMLSWEPCTEERAEQNNIYTKANDGKPSCTYYYEEDEGIDHVSTVCIDKNGHETSSTY